MVVLALGGGFQQEVCTKPLISTVINCDIGILVTRTSALQNPEIFNTQSEQVVFLLLLLLFIWLFCCFLLSPYKVSVLLQAYPSCHL